MDPVFLRVEVVLVLHDEAVEQYGGLQGVRDENLLMSALARPENKHAYSDPASTDLFDLAAAYAFGIAKNHPFNDANKRTAISACIAFLQLNGISLPQNHDEAVEQMVALAEGSLDEPAFATWLRTLSA